MKHKQSDNRQIPDRDIMIMIILFSLYSVSQRNATVIAIFQLLNVKLTKHSTLDHAI